MWADPKADVFRLLGPLAPSVFLRLLRHRERAHSDRPVGSIARRVAVEVTRSCPLSCSMCLVRKERHRPGNTLTVRGVADLCRRYAPQQVTLTGGEPLWRRDICEIVEELASVGAEVVILTSGQAHPTVDIERLARIRGLSICLSIDGPHSVHDTIRGKHGCLDEALQTLGLLRSRAEASAQLVLLPANLLHLRETIGICLDAGIRRLTLNHESFVTKREYEETCEILMQLGIVDPSSALCVSLHESPGIEPSELRDRIRDAIAYGLARGILVFPSPPLLFALDPKHYLNGDLRTGRCDNLVAPTPYFDSAGRRIICTNLRIPVAPGASVPDSPSTRLLGRLAAGRLLPVCSRCCRLMVTADADVHQQMCA